MELSKRALEIKPSSTLAITAKANQMKKEGIDIVGFGAGEPDFDTPMHIKQAAVEAITEGFTKYTPESGIIELRKAICDKFQQENGLRYEPNQIVVSNGAKHSLTNIFMAILNPEDEVIIPAPFWLSYPQMVKIADGTPVIVYTKKENHFKLTKDEIEDAITEKTKAIVLNSPSNPTGMVYTRDELKEIADLAVEHDLFVVSDEIYEKLIYDQIEHISIASLHDEIYKRTIIVNGVSKSYSMTGWRIGYTASSVQIATLMSNVQSHSTSNANSIAQKAALAAIAGPQGCVQVMHKEFEARRNYAFEKINSIPHISVIKPQGAFYLFVEISDLIGKAYKGKNIQNATDLGAMLLEEEKVAVVPCTDFGFDNYIRLSYAISLENIIKGLDRIEDFIVNKLEGSSCGSIEKCKQAELVEIS